MPRETVVGGLVAFSLLSTIGCQNKTEGVATEQGAFAMLSEDAEGLTILFTHPDHKDEAGLALADGLTDFWYIRFDVAEPDIDRVFSSDGLRIDLAENRVNPIVFAQRYRDLCNPAADIEGPLPRCWLSERYESGKEGLTGQIYLQGDDTAIRSAFEIAWEGLTDRFEGPRQWHRRTTGGGSAALLRSPR